MDLKEVLQEETIKNPKQSNNVKIHKKPIQLRDIENRSSSKTRLDQFESKEHIMELINKEKDHIFKQTWNKLDTFDEANTLDKLGLELMQFIKYVINSAKWTNWAWNLSK